MTPNAYLLWFALIAAAGCFLTGRWVVRRITRWLDRCRWQASTDDLTAVDWAAVNAAEAILRDAARAERRRT